MYYSFQSYELSNLQYKENHQLVLKGIVNEDELDLQVIPTSNTKTFLMGNVFLPTYISDLKDINIQPNGKFRYTPMIEYDIKQFLSKKYEWKEGYLQVSTLNLPIMIRSYYVSNGNSYIDRSIYMINLTFVIPEKEHEIVSLSFNGLIFFKRLSENDKFTDSTLNNMIKDGNVPCAKPSSKNK